MKRSCLWEPSPQRIENATLTQFKRFIETKYELEFSNYQDFYQWSVNQCDHFWEEFAEFSGIRFSEKHVEVLNYDIKRNTTNSTQDEFPTLEPHEIFHKARWFRGAKLNYAENLLRRNDDTVALVSYFENGQRSEITWRELNLKVDQLALKLLTLGVDKGDRVAAYMPNCIETTIAMLATTKLGAVWSSCSPDFGTQGVLDRFTQIQPKVLFSVDGYYYNGKTLDISEKVEIVSERLNQSESFVATIITPILNSPRCPESSLYLSLPKLLDEAPDDLVCNFEQVEFSDPLYILFSSGTTGTPKCIVHSVGGTLIQHLKEHALHVDLKPGDSIFYFTTCGWMMWNWLMSALASEAKVVLFDGCPFFPNSTGLIDIIDKENVSVFGTSAKYIAELEKCGAKPIASHSLASLHTVLSTGSPLSPESFRYIYRDFKNDVCLSSISGGTDIVSCFALGNSTLPVYEGQLQCRGLGMAVEIFDEKGKPVRNQKGELVCTFPFPSMPIEFYGDNNDEKYLSSYFKGFSNIWAHGDYGEISAENGVVIHGRSDAILNPGGVRIGTAEIYRQVEKLSWVKECVAVGQQWDDDVRVVLFVVLQNKEQLDEIKTKEIKTAIRLGASPRHVPAKTIQIGDIPRTFNGKVSEIAVRNVIHGDPVKNTDALANPESLKLYSNLQELSH